ncbi:hypothetical protein EAE96_002804 [Botrytis aclada]|nr:hypothetical protein EAE96_002804 [Botrytis aclada]
MVEENLFHSSDTSALLAVTDQEDKSGSAIKVVVPQPALQKQFPGQGPEFQQLFSGQGPVHQKPFPGQGPVYQRRFPGQGSVHQKAFPGPRPDFPKIANEEEMVDTENPTVEVASEHLTPAAPAQNTDKKIDEKMWCGPFCPRLTLNGKKQVKIKDLYFFLVTCRKGLPSAIAEVDPRVIDPERWEQEVEYPQTPKIARERRAGVLNGTLPEKFDLNLWHELDVNTGLSLGPQIHPAHAVGGQHRCYDAGWIHPSQNQEKIGSFANSRENWFNVEIQAAKRKKQGWQGYDRLSSPWYNRWQNCQESTPGNSSSWWRPWSWQRSCTTRWWLLWWA